MKIRIKMYPESFPDQGEIISWDTEQPGWPLALNWFRNQPFLNPNTLRVGATTGDGLHVYEVIGIEGPIFDLGGIYCQRFPMNSITNGLAITIIAREQDGDTWRYTFFQGIDMDKTWVLGEQEVIRFLTDPDFAQEIWER